MAAPPARTAPVARIETVGTAGSALAVPANSSPVRMRATTSPKRNSRDVNDMAPPRVAKPNGSWYFAAPGWSPNTELGQGARHLPRRFRRGAGDASDRRRRRATTRPAPRGPHRTHSRPELCSARRYVEPEASLVSGRGLPWGEGFRLSGRATVAGGLSEDSAYECWS